MTTIFRLDSSIRTEGSVSRAVADTLENAIIEAEGNDTRVTRRDLAADPVPTDAWATAAFAGHTPEDERTPEQQAAAALATQLADEVGAADVLIIGAPLYNFGVSQHLKTWFDLLITDPRFAGGAQTVKDKPAFLVIARGGGYGEGTPRAGWDHATGWLRRILEDVWGLDLDVIETELTLAEVTPQMAELRDLARAQLAESHEVARTSGRSVTLKLRNAA
ncbi:FMN-dependent NADH-azoreductase [Aeromicrobium wangtongii]|uniref:FMN dependent NADH:quinone oxidoreductase n=1 Tax=Aeromicrobium wangtongii TaxID=2969247 RepID=A0ABY5M9T1_9ACTN|nr:NAD(P)H-dependent oxidoreductase [Aeromicrobium wangtongii]MCD9199394.1 NAD(P)H-dependent oxidoreductase [Aeromicrobium wangtongii]UUP13750.1 NAD(P)H-dependent oxidoreductase [Aeromicrobium wangtongii]